MSEREFGALFFLMWVGSVCSLPFVVMLTRGIADWWRHRDDFKYLQDNRLDRWKR